MTKRMKNRGMRNVDANLTPESTSYFSAPSSELDPQLFDQLSLKPWVRTGILSLLFDNLAVQYSSVNRWIHVWLAGSGVSYQWEASRSPGDLDCLVGINYVVFRSSNPEFAGYSDQEIASMFNEGFNLDLMPHTRNWEGYELTFYVNQHTNIQDINPYAAYDLIADSWTVAPEPNPQPPYNRAWEARAQRDQRNAEDLVGRHSNALNEVRSASNPAHKINAQRKLKLAEDQVTLFYDDIHAGRKLAFSSIGQGYSDYNNYRWQAGKRSGAVQALRTIKEQKLANTAQSHIETYGIELPDTNTLIRRSLRGK